MTTSAPSTAPSTTTTNLTGAHAVMSATMHGELSRLAFALADQRVQSAVTSICKPPVALPGSAHTWYDTRTMLSPHERSAASIDQCRQALMYGEYRRILQRHPEHTHLVRIVTPG